jgi:hypothetical protein
MSKQTIRILGILLAVCFLMSVTVAAVSADPCDNSYASQKNARSITSLKGTATGLKGFSKGRNVVVIRNMIIARNVVINNVRSTHPLLRAALLKGMMNKKGMINTGTTNQAMTGSTSTETGTTCTGTESTESAGAQTSTTGC